MASLSTLASKQCKELKSKASALIPSGVASLLKIVRGWKRAGGHPVGDHIERTFKFKDYYETMAFVNAIAWISHAQNHHPDLEVGYNQCVVKYSTHSVGGLSENDFICAAKIEAMTKL